MLSDLGTTQHYSQTVLSAAIRKIRCESCYAREFETTGTVLRESNNTGEGNSSYFFFLSITARLWLLKIGFHKLKMSLDVTACLKALSSAFCQYRSHNTDHNTKDLERQIDVSC